MYLKSRQLEDFCHCSDYRCGTPFLKARLVVLEGLTGSGLIRVLACLLSKQEITLRYLQGNRRCRRRPSQGLATTADRLFTADANTKKRREGVVE